MEKEKKYGDLHKVTLIDFSSLVLRVESSIDRFCISDGWVTFFIWSLCARRCFPFFGCRHAPLIFFTFQVIAHSVSHRLGLGPHDVATSRRCWMKRTKIEVKYLLNLQQHHQQHHHHDTHSHCIKFTNPASHITFHICRQHACFGPHVAHIHTHIHALESNQNSRPFINFQPFPATVITIVIIIFTVKKKIARNSTRSPKQSTLPPTTQNPRITIDKKEEITNYNAKG